jgi:membrane protease YdiL (CAAX protease family)
MKEEYSMDSPNDLMSHERMAAGDSSGAVVRLWRSLPVLVRSILSGLFVFLMLQSGWTFLMVSNMSTSPAIPWSVPLGLLYLWIVFRYFNGKWAPRSTSDARRDSMRARRLSSEEWKLALTAAFSVMIFFLAVTFLSYRLIEIPAEDMAMPDMPWWSLYAALVMVSIVAGVSEEAGFRGYVQRPLEKRYGAVIAIGVSATCFWLVHLNHSAGLLRAPSLLVMGISLGILATCARSILPAIIAHATADTIVFVGSVSEIGPSYIWQPVLITETGLDGFFWVLMLMIVGSGIGAPVALRRLATMTRKTEEYKSHLSELPT